MYTPEIKRDLNLNFTLEGIKNSTEEVIKL